MKALLAVLACLAAAAAFAATPATRVSLDGDAYPDLVSRSINTGTAFLTVMGSTGTPTTLTQIVPSLSPFGF